MYEPISPELALVDPDLAARARAALPEPVLDGPVRARSTRPEPASAAAPAPTRQASTRPYPLWARMTAALWLLVLGILIGGAAIPHAQDTPRILPPAENVICEPEKQIAPTVPDVGSPLRPGP
jgi:hypothetical protein